MRTARRSAASPAGASAGSLGAPDGFTTAFRAAVAARGLSLTQLRQHVAERGHKVSVATLSHWHSGRSRPEREASRAALTVIEEILDLPVGALTGQLFFRQSAPEETSFAVAAERAARLEEMVRELGLSWRYPMQRVSLHERLGINPVGALTSHMITEVMRGVGDGMDRFPVGEMDHPGGNPPQIHAASNCTVGRVVRDEKFALTVAELVLPKHLRHGDPLLVEHAWDGYDQNCSDDSWHRGLATPMREVHAELYFDDRRLPSSVERFVQEGDKEERSEPIPLTGNRVSATGLDFGPGVLGFRWRW